MVYNSYSSIRGIAPVLYECYGLSITPTAPTDSPSISTKRPIYSILSPPVSPSGLGLSLRPSRRFESPVRSATELLSAGAPVTRTNMCTHSLIRSSPVSPSDSKQHSNPSKSFAAGTSSLVAAAPGIASKSALSFILSPPSLPPLEHGGLTGCLKSTQSINRKRPWFTPCGANRRSIQPYSNEDSTKLQQSRCSTARSHDVKSTNSVPAKKASSLCIVDGCIKLHKHNKRCWRHGGSIKCKVADCTNRAKSKGVCWSHGGGTLCTFESCATISVSKGLCWAHGGGKRCLMSLCSRPAYERTQNYCKAHFKAIATGGQRGGVERVSRVQ